jgi:hypothetical protein
VPLIRRSPGLAALTVLALASSMTRPAAAQGKDAPWKSYGDVTRGAQPIPGVFTTYLRRDNVLLGLRPEQMDRDYLLVTQLAQGIGDAGLDGGATLRSDVIRFHRAGDRVELWVVNTHVTADPGTPMARTVASSFGHSVAQSFPIATVKDTSEVLVDVTNFLVSDWADLAQTLAAVAAQRRLPSGPGFDRERSSLLGVRVFPTNFEADVRLTFSGQRPLGIETVADGRWVPLGVHYSIVELPATPMRARYADDRVGYFVTAFKDFSRDTAESFFVRYVNRWRLERRDTLAGPGGLSEPVRPITYYVDRTVPAEWRPYVRAGILEWNKAFEQAGWRNAIRVLDAPDDSLWSAEDARYSTVRWTATNRAVYAVGPTTVDPRSGEILNADVLISAQWIQAWRGEAGLYGSPATATAAAFRTDSLLRADTTGAASERSELLCAAGEGLAREGVVMRALLAASGRVPAGAALPREYIGAALKQLVMHEIGHTLGLRHNFRGSAGVPLGRIADRGWTAQHGLAASVMDYLPAAVAADARRQGDYYSATVGTYDRWAIRYGYAPIAAGAAPNGKGAEAAADAWSPDRELGGLRAIAAEAGAPGHGYATDEDAAFGGWGLDPTVSRYDLGDDPLAWARGRVALIDALADSLDGRLVAPGDGYAKLRGAFADLLTDRFYATMVAAKYVGGAYTARDHRGDPDGRPALTPVPAARQQEALAFAVDAVFGDSAWRFRPALLARLAPDRWSHWGSNPAAQERIDFPLHDWAESQQSALLGTLLDPAVLDRVRDNEARTTDGTPFTLPDLFDGLVTGTWSEVIQSKGRTLVVNAFRRDGQRQVLNALVRLVVAPAPGTPEDARALARAELGDLAAVIDRALPRAAGDAYTRAHLLDARQRIRQALDA